MSGACEASPMEGVTGTMSWLSHVPGCSRAGLYGPANIDFPFVYELRVATSLSRAAASRSRVPRKPPSTESETREKCCGFCASCIMHACGVMYKPNGWFWSL